MAPYKQDARVVTNPVFKEEKTAGEGLYKKKSEREYLDLQEKKKTCLFWAGRAESAIKKKIPEKYQHPKR